MHRVRKHTGLLVVTALLGWMVVGSGGCNEQPPPEQYEEDLGQDKALLPTGSYAYSADITQGRAKVVEYEPMTDEDEEDVPDGDMDTEDAEEVGADEPAGDDADAGPSGGGLAAAAARFENAEPATPEVEAAIQTVWDDYQAAAKELRLDDAMTFLIEEDRAVFRVMAPAQRTMVESFMDLSEFADAVPTTAAAAKQTLDAMQKPEVLVEVRSLGPGTAIGEVQTNQPMLPTMHYQFEQQGDSWLIRSPVRLTMEDANEMAVVFQDTNDVLEELLDSLDAEEIDDQAAMAKLGQALQGFGARVQPILMRMMQGASDGG
jgi:hypothetical protein